MAKKVEKPRKRLRLTVIEAETMITNSEGLWLFPGEETPI